MPRAAAAGCAGLAASRPWRCRSRCQEPARAREASSPTIGGSLRRREGGTVQGVGFILVRRRKAHANDTPSSFGFTNDLFDTPLVRSCEPSRETPIGRRWGDTVVIEEDAVAVARGVASAAATRSDCRSHLAAACLDSGRTGRTSRVRCPADAPSSRSGCGSRAFAPARQEWPLRRTATRARRCRSAIAPARPADSAGGTSPGTPSQSSRQPLLSKSTARKKQVSSRSIG